MILFAPLKGMEGVAAEALKSTATAALGSAVSTGAEKGADAAKGEKTPDAVKAGINVGQMILTTFVTTLAIEIFGRITKKTKGAMYYIVALLVSLVASAATAYARTVL